MSTTPSYSTLAKSLHWLTAVLIIALFALGLWMVDLSYYDAWYRRSLDLHKSFGITLALLFIIRLINRVMHKQPEPIAAKAWQKKAAHIVHLLMYVLVIMIIIAGYLISTADGRAIAVFELFNIPAIISQGESQAELAGQIHEWLAYTLIALVLVHLLAALQHHFIYQDKTLNRMLFNFKGKQQ